MLLGDYMCLHTYSLLIILAVADLSRFDENFVRFLQDNCNMRQVCKCIEADDVFHAKWEHAAMTHHHNAVAHMYGK